MWELPILIPFLSLFGLYPTISNLCYCRTFCFLAWPLRLSTAWSFPHDSRCTWLRFSHEFLAVLSDSSLLWAFVFLLPSSWPTAPPFFRGHQRFRWTGPQLRTWPASAFHSSFSTTEMHFSSLQVIRQSSFPEQTLYFQTSSFFPHCLWLCLPYLCLSEP